VIYIVVLHCLKPYEGVGALVMMQCCGFCILQCCVCVYIADISE